jgi:hypothetical protein
MCGTVIPEGIVVCPICKHYIGNGKPIPTDSILATSERESWLLKDLKTRCHNLQNKITPYKAKESKLNARARSIRRDKGVDEITSWELLYSELKRIWRDKNGQQT